MRTAPHELRAALRRLIDRRGLTITEAARRAGIPRERLSRMLTGKGDITPGQYRRLYRALGCYEPVYRACVAAIEAACGGKVIDSPLPICMMRHE